MNLPILHPRYLLIVEVLYAKHSTFSYTNHNNCMGFVMYFNIVSVLLLGLIWIGIITYLRRKNKKSLVYLIFFTIFYIYIIKVLDYTLFQFQSLILLKYFMPNLILNGQDAGQNLNLLPLLSLNLSDLKTSLLNILLFIPFGFGLPFIKNIRMKNIVMIGALFSITIELLQLLTGLIANVTFRVADINDLIFNSIGVVIGYILFKLITQFWLRFWSR
jgi:glycopeptide antibiotics resistance protein